MCWAHFLVRIATVVLVVLPVVDQIARGEDRESLFLEPLGVEPRPIATATDVRYDYDIVYVRARRAGDQIHKRFYTDFSQPVTLEPGADLMLLHPVTSSTSHHSCC